MIDDWFVAIKGYGRARSFKGNEYQRSLKGVKGNFSGGALSKVDEPRVEYFNEIGKKAEFYGILKKKNSKI